MSVYVVSDVHGCFDELMSVLEKAAFGDDDQLYMLGDLIDRGTQVGACIEWLVANDANGDGSNIHFIWGNHEELADWSFIGKWSQFRFDEVYLPQWLMNGGDKTLEHMRKLDPNLLDAFQQILKGAPKALALQMDDGLVLLSHAGIRPAEPEAERGEWLIQAEEDLMWIGVEWYCAFEQAPFHVVSGHTPTVSLAERIPDSLCSEDVRARGRAYRMMHWGCRHDIDCGCVFGGNLGLLRLDDKEEFYVSRKTL